MSIRPRSTQADASTYNTISGQAQKAVAHKNVHGFNSTTPKDSFRVRGSDMPAMGATH